MRVGSSPTTIGSKSSTAPTTLRVFHSREASPQPYSPGTSVSTFTKTQLRISAFTTIVFNLLIFIALICYYSYSPGCSTRCSRTQPSRPANDLAVFHDEVYFAQGVDVLEWIFRDGDHVSCHAWRNRSLLFCDPQELVGIGRPRPQN